MIARLNVGGPARHVLLLNDALTQKGYDTLLVHGSLGPGEASFEHLAVERGLQTCKIVSLGRRIQPARDLRAFIELVRLLFAEDPDVVHTHTAKAGALGRVAAAIYNATRQRARRCVVVHTFHGHVLTGYFASTATSLVRLAERLLARLTDCVIAISPTQERELVDRFRISSDEQTVMIPLGLDLSPLPGDISREAARRRLDVDVNAFGVGYVGRFVPVKDVETLVRAFSRVAHALPRAVLLLVGDGPTRPHVERLAEQLNVRHKVELIGWRNDLVEVYAAMNVCCLSSLNEGTPVALIEAMAAKRPVVATRVGGVIDIVEDGRTGILVEPRDPVAMADAILRLASDPAGCERMGELGRASVITRFSVDRLAQDVHSTYLAQLTRKRGLEAVPTV